LAILFSHLSEVAFCLYVEHRLHPESDLAGANLWIDPYKTAAPQKALKVDFLMFTHHFYDVIVSIPIKQETKMTSRKVLAVRQTERTSGGHYLPSPSEGALLLLLLAESKDKELSKEKPTLKKITRFRVSEATLTRVLGRARLSSGFLEEVQEWLLVAGWALIFTGTTYALIKVTAVEGWIRLASKRIAAELETVKKGKFDFASQQHLLNPFVSNGDDDDAGEEDADDE
jgi:hypothetical protein